jgi:hypothetical protein
MGGKEDMAYSTLIYLGYFKRLLLKLNEKYCGPGRQATFHSLKDVTVENFNDGFDHFLSNSTWSLQIQNPSCTRTNKTSLATKDPKSMPYFMLLNQLTFTTGKLYCLCNFLSWQY